MVEEWRDDFPKTKGWYDCQVDGERVRLLLFICELTNKKHWITAGGDYLDGERVLWTGGPHAK